MLEKEYHLVRKGASQVGLQDTFLGNAQAQAGQSAGDKGERRLFLTSGDLEGAGVRAAVQYNVANFFGLVPYKILDSGITLAYAEVEVTIAGAAGTHLDVAIYALDSAGMFRMLQGSMVQLPVAGVGRASRALPASVKLVADERYWLGWWASAAFTAIGYDLNLTARDVRVPYQITAAGLPQMVHLNTLGRITVSTLMLIPGIGWRSAQAVAWNI